MYLTVFVLVLGVVLTVLNIYELHRMKSEHVKELEVYVEGSLDGKASGPIVWVEGEFSCSYMCMGGCVSIRTRTFRTRTNIIYIMGVCVNKNKNI
jgi:hypothetical protein